MFSRIASDLPGEKNPLYKLQAEVARQSRSIVDLVSGNVNEHGILFPQPLLEEIIIAASRRCKIYRPDPFGQAGARTAISDYYGAQGLSIDPQQILVTPGTSVSYWYCFKLLANEGEEILCPRPTYPLFDYIARLCSIRLIHYFLDEARDWAIDFESLENRISNDTRAVVLISPHNPTGHVATRAEIERLVEISRRHNLAIIADEVFSEFVLTGGRLVRAAASGAPLVFTLNGFSKMFALPGFKFGWAAVSGDAYLVTQALRALELISDTFLPVNEIAQAAAPEIFHRGAPFLGWYSEEVASRWKLMEGFLRRLISCRFVRPAGGFYVTVRLEGIDEEKASEALLRDDCLLVHPGYFYDMSPHHLVFSFVQHPELMQEYLPKLAANLARFVSRS